VNGEASGVLPLRVFAAPVREAIKRFGYVRMRDAWEQVHGFPMVMGTNAVEVLKVIESFQD